MLTQIQKSFIAAAKVIEILEEHGASAPSVTLYSDGSGSISLVETDYLKFKSLAEDLLMSKGWWTDVYGNYCLSSMDGFQTENENYKD